MAKTTYRDLAEFGLPLVSPESATFPALVRDIEARPQPFASWPASDLDTAAVLLNQSGKAIVTIAYVWQYKTPEGQTRASHFSNLGSSMQMDVLSGHSAVTRDLASFVLPGSKRLITEQGMFGNNLDVLPPESVGHGGSYIGASGGRALRRGLGDEELAEVELTLDSVILEDGLCLGPDESGLFESIAGDLELRRKTAQEIVTALRDGASAGDVFEILRPLARHGRAEGSMGHHGRIPSMVLSMFANTAIHRLINTATEELLPWLESIAQSSPLPLHRP